MILTNTHTHLYSPQFNEDRNNMMQRSFDASVTHFFVPAIDSGHAERMYLLEKDFPNNVFLMMGYIHAI